MRVELRLRIVFCGALLALTSLLPASAPAKDDTSFPPATAMESKPWTYWWWMGSAVTREDISANLEMFASAGIGGVHIIPIYGVKGYEDSYIEFLSPQWMEMFAFTVSEANRLGMGVDMTTGTGWPLGGPQVTDALAAKTFKVRKPRGVWEVEARNTGQKVKRAAPGGEGLVMDHYSREALDQYLDRFDRAFAGTDARPRCFYNDSFEVYGADWTDDMLAEFEARRGYDLADHLDALAGKGDSEQVARVMYDYRETVSDLLLEEFTMPWAEWSQGMGAITRDQAHGSPGNLLDLYAAADIPETEAFGPSHFDIPGLTYYRTLPEHRGGPDILVMKFASSAAHLGGKRLVSSESCTWLGEHFTVSLAQVKPEIDKLWLGGINHVFFHGTAYSPVSEQWPGWLFYASTNFGPSNTLFRDLPALNSYIARTQAFLQSGKPENDVLLYWPVHDLWSNVYDPDPKKEFMDGMGRAFNSLFTGRMKMFADHVQSAMVGWYEARQSKVRLFTVHDADAWLHRTPFGETTRYLQENGYAFDYVSDRMVMRLSWKSGIVSESGASYRAIVVPPCRYMPVETMEKLVELARKGASIIFQEDFPGDVPGLVSLEERRARLRNALDHIGPGESPGRGIEKASPGKGTVLVGKDLGALLQAAGLPRETMAGQGLSFIRRAHQEGRYYFIANLGPRPFEGFVSPATPMKSAVIFDTLHQRAGVAMVENDSDGMSRVYIQLLPGQSLVIKTFSNRTAGGPPWKYLEPCGEPVAIRGRWKIEFIQGGAALPPPYETDELASWTERQGKEYKQFSGTARYTIEFELPPAPESTDWMLDLGEVHESARVFINREDAGVVFCHPFQVRAGGYLRPGRNLIEIEVTSLAANRIIGMDRQRVSWKKFHDINFVNVDYLPFNAAWWEPFPSGLIGPVRLVPERERR